MEGTDHERWLVVGLGNPGEAYAGTRHNLGFSVADLLAKRAGSGDWRRRFDSQLCEGRLGTRKIWILKPMTYMNASGPAIAQALRYSTADVSRTIVVHDDVDLELGRLRLRVGGGDGGHKGVRSAIEHVGPDFVRARVGVGKNASRDTSDWVLGRFAGSERQAVDMAVASAADAVETVLREGITAAMNRYNVRAKKDAKKSESSNEEA